jgi:hypothetical protein
MQPKRPARGKGTGSLAPWYPASPFGMRIFDGSNNAGHSTGFPDGGQRMRQCLAWSGAEGDLPSLRSRHCRLSLSSRQIAWKEKAAKTTGKITTGAVVACCTLSPWSKRNHRE